MPPPGSSDGAIRTYILGMEEWSEGMIRQLADIREILYPESTFGWPSWLAP